MNTSNLYNKLQEDEQLISGDSSGQWDERFKEVTCSLHYTHKFHDTNDVSTTYLGSYMAEDESRTFPVDNHIPFDGRGMSKAYLSNGTWLNNILVMTCTAMTTVLMVIILVFLEKHFKMKALVSMLAIQTVPPPVKAVNLTATMMSAMIAPDPAIGTKVMCAYPVAVIWQNILGYLVLAYAITQFFRPVTWCKGYKYNKKCALYIFVYDEDHERYSPLKIMSLKVQMHNYRMKYTGEGISLTLMRSWTYDTMTISWGGVQVIDKSDRINLPATVTVALRHKIMTRRIAQQLGEVQYMLKQGSSWHDITDYYRARKKAVNLKVETEGMFNTRTGEYDFIGRSIPIFPQNDLDVPAGEKAYIKVRAPFCDKLSGMICTKFFGRDMVYTLRVKFQDNQGVVQFRNGSDEIAQLRKDKAVGILDLRSIGYFKVGYQKMVNMAESSKTFKMYHYQLIKCETKTGDWSTSDQYMRVTGR